MKSLAVLFLLIAATSAFAQLDSLHVLWDRSGQTDSSAYGYKILPLGDQNDDGFNDWAVYAAGNGGGYHGTRASYLEFFHGGNPMPTEPYMTYHVDTTIYNKQWGVDQIGDINGDGFRDWLVRKCTIAGPVTCIGEVFFGGPVSDSIPDLDFPASSIGGIGDFNGDQYDDIATYDFQTDILSIYYGGSPMDTLPDWIIHQPPAGLNQTIPYAVGDFNGDGASDFVCWNPNNRNAAVFLGGTLPDTLPAYVWTDLRGPIGGIVSINGDGYDEFLTGGGLVHFGRPVLSPMPDCTLHFAQNACYNGPQQVIGAGDINHDGYQDAIMLASYCADNWFGALTVHLGHPWIYPNPAFEIDGWSDPLNLIGIYTATGLGDVNGDGIDDIAIGAYHDTAYLGWRGRCVILSGDTGLVADADQPVVALPEKLEVAAFPNPFNSTATVRLDLPAYTPEVQLTLFNVLGQVVRSITLSHPSQTLSFPLDASDLSTGLYLLQATSANLSVTTKLVVLR